MYDSIIVIGIGNENRTDDGVGLAVADNIKNMNLPHVSVDYECRECSGIIAKWKHADIAILIDATISKKVPPGTIHRFDLSKDTLPSNIFTRFSTHAFSIVDTIQLAQSLKQLPPRVIVYGIECKSFERGMGLTAEVANAVSIAAEKIRDEIHLLLSGEISP